VLREYGFVEVVMGLISRLARFAAVLALLAYILGMSGCGAVDGSTNHSSANGSVSLARPMLDFGTVAVGSSRNLSDVITNNSTTPVTLAVRYVGKSFHVDSPSLPLKIAPGQQATLAISFRPQGASRATGKISFVGSGNRLQVDLAVSGTSVKSGRVTASPASVVFGNVSVGQSRSLTATLSNPGSSSVTIGHASISNAAYTIPNLKLPMVLDPGRSTTVAIEFSPKSSGTQYGSITLHGSAPAMGGGEDDKEREPEDVSDDLTIALSGTGTAPPKGPVGMGTLSANPASVRFSSVAVGNSQTQSGTITNSGQADVTISQISSRSASFSPAGLNLPLTLAPGRSMTFNIVFAPKSVGSLSGQLSIVSNASNRALAVWLIGVGTSPEKVSAGILTASPSSLNFSSVAVGGTRSQSETLTNSGKADVTISQITSGSTSFIANGLSLPTTLAPGRSFTFNVVFSPTSVGSSSNRLNVASNASNPGLMVALTGSGASVGKLSLASQALNFGSVPVGSSKSLSEKLTASSSGVVITSASSNSAEFSITGLSLPLTLASGQSASFNVTFTPKNSGTASGSIAFANSAGGSLPVSATGTGTAATLHKVTVSWTGSTSSVVSYNVYRGTQTGGPYALINSDSGDSFSDTGVQGGTTYFYVVTAVDASGGESMYSNEARATVPTP
jgi:hypothetical protein